MQCLSSIPGRCSSTRPLLSGVQTLTPPPGVAACCPQHAHPHQHRQQHKHISAAVTTAAAAEGPPRQRRGSSQPSYGGGRGGGGRGGSGGGRVSGRGRGGGRTDSSYTQETSWQQQQQQQRSRRPPPQRRQPSSAGYDEEYDAVDPLEQEFLDPEQAAKLRKLMKAKGRSAVVDSQGFVRLPVLPEGEDGEEEEQQQQRDSSGSRQRRRPGRAGGGGAGSGVAATPAWGGVRDPAAAGTRVDSASAGRARLFDASQLQAAAPGSGGAVAALPIVRPTSSSTTSGSSTSSPDRAAIAAAAAVRSKAGAASASGFYSSSSWRELGASQVVQETVAALGISRPSHVQVEAYKALRLKSGFKHVALADQAGSGKTLAYLLPLLQQLKEREQQLGGPATTPNSPSIIIVTPTTELAQQVGRVVRALSQAGLRVRSAIMTGGQSDEDRRSKTLRTQTELLDGGVDVLVATPGRLLGHHQRGSLNLSNTAALVLDEVDVLAGGELDYMEHVAPLRAAAPPSMRCVLVSATLPQHTFDELQELFMGLGAAFGPGLHRTAQGVVEELIDCSGGDEISLETGTARKLEALFTSLDRNRSPRTVVFCNKIETCRVVENALRRQMPNHQVLVYHEAIREELRSAALNTWLAPPRDREQPMVLVCTDRTSRGIDSMWCEHVVLFEFPRDPSEYVRRVGRTARGAGGKGVVSVLVLGKQVPLAKDILERNRDGVPVHRVPRLWSDK